MFVDPDYRHPVEAGRFSDECPLAFGEHRVVGGVPRHRQCLGDPRHAQVLADEGFQRPAQHPAGELGPWLGGLAAVLAPHMRTAGTPVPAHGDQQGRGPPSEWLVRKLTGDGVTHAAPFPAAATPRVVIGDPARQHRPIRLQALSGHLQPELIKAAEHGQIGASEGSVRHVEVSQMRCVGTLILGRPRPLSRQRRADHLYTLNCEEPVKSDAVRCYQPRSGESVS
ncbi:hypothetical protein MINTM005_22090 [Mycobacterium intracellulare]|nr:hypothetical protein MINTM005_22090 [Mycobacterium intracellulare]